MKRIEGTLTANSNEDLRRLVADLLSKGYQLVAPIRENSHCATIFTDVVEPQEAQLISGAAPSGPILLPDAEEPPDQTYILGSSVAMRDLRSGTKRSDIGVAGLATGPVSAFRLLGQVRPPSDIINRKGPSSPPEPGGE